MARRREAATISAERYAELEGKEEFILTVTSRGYGKRSSAYEYRIAGRGGQGIANMDITERNGQVVASFPVAQRDQIMLVTDRGQLIRCPVNDIRIAGRKTGHAVQGGGGRTRRLRHPPQRRGGRQWEWRRKRRRQWLRQRQRECRQRSGGEQRRQWE
jgi:DNA gyrase/topoisomerase IV subunit A